MFHPLLAAQLAQFGLTADEPPDEAQWQAWLAELSQTYTQRAAEQDRLQAVLDNVADAIITFDENGRIEWFNRAAEHMFGYTAATMRERSLELLLPNPHHHQVREDTLALQTSKDDGRADIVSISNEIVGQRHDGQLFPVAFTISQMMVQGQRQFIGIVRDITARKQAEAALVAAKEVAETANRAKTEFLANTSHEIRTPLNAIVGLTSLLLDTELTSDQQMYVEIARRSSHNLLAILNDILDLSRIEAGKLALEQRPYHLQASILEVTHLLQASASDKKLHLYTDFMPDMPQVFVGDGTRVRQVLTNLVSNAIKFTHEGEIQIRAGGRYLDEANYEIHIAVRDTGIGLPADYTEWLFQPFRRGRADRSRHYGGTGLGLTISQRLVELMDGRIWVESQPGQGATFHIALPNPVTEQPAPTTQTMERVRQFDPDMAQQLPLRILIAEDNVTNQKVMMWMLQHLGYTPDVAANGLETLDALRQHSYDVILMDLLMPEMDGRAATKIIRASFPQDQQPWIIAVTADILHENRETYLAEGLNDYLSKPIQAEALITALCRCPPATSSSSTPPWPVDRQVLAQAVAHNNARMDELLAIFRAESNALLARLQAAVTTQDIEMVRHLAHSLKGSCATMGMVSLVALFREIETLAQNQEGHLGDKVNQALAEHERVLAALAAK